MRHPLLVHTSNTPTQRLPALTNLLRTAVHRPTTRAMALPSMVSLLTIRGMADTSPHHSQTHHISRRRTVNHKEAIRTTHHSSRTMMVSMVSSTTMVNMASPLRTVVDSTVSSKEATVSRGRAGTQDSSTADMAKAGRGMVERRRLSGSRAYMFCNAVSRMRPSGLFEKRASLLLSFVMPLSRIRTPQGQRLSSGTGHDGRNTRLNRVMRPMAQSHGHGPLLEKDFLHVL